MSDAFLPFEHVVIQGVGLLGASLGMAIRHGRLAQRVTGVGRAGSRSVEIARERGAIDEASTDLAAAARTADLVVLCAPVRQFPAAMRTLAPALRPGTIVTDVGSTKAQVMQWALELLPAHVHFIGSHPMAGSEKSGPEAARRDLYDKAVCMMTAPWQSGTGSAPSAEQRAAFERVEKLWQAVGMRIMKMPADVHDRWVATISHLPHALASTLASVAGREPEMLDAAAGGFMDTSRLASGDVDMWTDIFLTNRAVVADVLGEFQKELAAFKQAVAAGNEEAIRESLTSAKSVRDAFIARRVALGMSVKGGGDTEK